MMTFLLRRRRRFVLFVVAGVEIGRLALELSGAGIDKLEDWLQPGLVAQLTYLICAGGRIQVPDLGDTCIGDSHALGLAQ